MKVSPTQPNTAVQRLSSSNPATTSASDATRRFNRTYRHREGWTRAHGTTGKNTSVSTASTVDNHHTKTSLSSSKDISDTSRVDDKYMPFLDAWDRTFTNAEEEVEGYECQVEGEIPQEITGTLFRNGPNRFDIVNHPYDGDGFIARLSIENGKAYFKSRFVETFEYSAEKNVDRALFRGTFATQRENASNFGDIYVKNTSNTNIQYYDGNLWTFFEAGQPYRICPSTLETLGIDTFGGAVKTGLPFDLGSSLSNTIMGKMVSAAQKFSGEEYFASGMGVPDHLIRAGGHAVTAHPRIVDGGTRFCTFSYQMKMGVIDASEISFPPLYTEIRFMEFSGSTMVREKTVSIPGFAFLHDFVVTDHYYIIFKNPVTVDNVAYMSGSAPAASCVRWIDGKPTILYVIPRDPGSARPIEKLTLPGLFVFHHANAYDTAQGNEITIDSIHYPSLPAVGKEALPSQSIDPNAAFQSRLKRVHVNLEEKTATISNLCDEYLEMPTICRNVAGKRHRYVYGYQSDFPNRRIGVTQVDTEKGGASSWFPGPGEFLLEPHFIPKHPSTTEDAAADYCDTHEGWVIAQYFDANTTQSGFFIFDAAQLPRGPIAKIFCKGPLPSALHGCWTPALFH